MSEEREQREIPGDMCALLGRIDEGWLRGPQRA